MALQLILGSSGQGKTSYLMEEVIRESMKDPSQNYYILVPEQFSLEMQRQMILKHPKHGFSNIDVLSFYRLAYVIFEECGYEPKEILEDLGVSMILKKVLLEHEQELLFFKRSMRHPGFVDELKSMLMEFMNYGIHVDDMETMGQTLEKYPALASKCSELSKIYGWFQEKIENQFMVSSQILEVLKDMVADSKILQEGIFYLDGYTGFTPIQLAFLRKLLPQTKQVKVTVTIPYLPSGNRKIPKMDLFSFSEKTIYALSDLCKECGVEWEEPVILSERTARRYGDNAELAHVESQIFHEVIHSYDQPLNKIHAVSCQNPEEEAEFVLHKIEELVRKKGYRYRDFAILMGREEDYPAAFVRRSQALGLPLFVDTKQKMAYHSGVETIRSLFHLVEMDYSYESVFRYLKSGMSQFSGEEIDYLENYILSSGVRGLSMWKKPFYRRLQRLDAEKIAFLDQLRLGFLEETLTFAEKMKDKKATVCEKMTVLYETLIELHFVEKMKEKAVVCEAEADYVKSKGYEQFFKQLLDLMDKIVAIFGEETLSVEEISQLFDAGLESLSLASPPLSMDQTILGDLKRTRLPEIKVLFFVGMNDGDIPPVPEERGILSDDEKRILEEHGVTLSLNLTERVLEDEYYMYLAFSKPQEELYLSYCTNDASGAAKRPSTLFSVFQKIFPQLIIRSYPEEERRLYFHEKDSKEYLISQLRNWYDGNETEEAAFYALFSYWNEKHPEELDRYYEQMSAEETWLPLKKDVIEELYGDELSGSVTKMEKFAGCPFDYYLSYGLRLQEREEYQILPMDLGHLFHAALEYFSENVKKEGYSWKNIPEEVQEKLLNNAVEMTVDEKLRDVMESSGRNQYKKKMVERILRRTVEVLRYHLRNSDFNPDQFELRFTNGDTLESTKIPLSNGHRIAFQGVIDRVDICEEDDRIYVKIIDYKSGSKTFDFNELYYGLQLQLIVYLKAALEIYQKEKKKTVEPAGVFYYGMKDPIQKAKDISGDKKMDVFRMSGYANSDPKILEHLEHHGSKMESFHLSFNKDGNAKKNSPILSTDAFYAVGDYVTSTIREMGERIYAGEIAAKPYKFGQKNACMYCRYRSVCGFDERNPKHEYHLLEKRDIEDILGDDRGEMD
ncbi:MAG: PD-(D/E)XK nuclease family protein [Eubacteriales bacterium]|nr:PD-(D/E)XK nuclease family protein [Eubacteriales bacterium]